MQTTGFTASDGHEVAVYAWVSEQPKAIVQIAHGMGEHAQRYDWVGTQLAEAGYAVYANDHRGHGQTRGPVQGYMGADGWNRCIADMYEFGQWIRTQHNELKVCLMGHSMGSMLSQQYITRHGASIDALVLSGSPGFKQGSRLSFIQNWITRFEHWRFGADGHSEFLQNALFATNNEPFDSPTATGYEWLSRDADEVRKYVDDPECGFVLTVGSLMDMSRGVAITQDQASLAKIPRSLPMFVFSGIADPVAGEQGEDVDRMVATYREHRLNVTDYELYPDGRHEMFNETNKQEVMDNLLRWLSETL